MSGLGSENQGTVSPRPDTTGMGPKEAQRAFNEWYSAGGWRVGRAANLRVTGGLQSPHNGNLRDHGGTSDPDNSGTRRARDAGQP
jgi:hypothetical protein